MRRLRRSAHKKEFCNTIMRGKKIRAKKEFLYTTHARREKCKNVQKCTIKKKAEKPHKAEQKRGLMARYRHAGKSLDFPGKREFMHTICAGGEILQKATQKRMRLSDMAQIGRSLGAPGASCSSIFHFLSPQKVLQIPQSLKCIRRFWSP